MVGETHFLAPIEPFGFDCSSPEQSLATIDNVLTKLRTKIRRMDIEMRELVRSQTEVGQQTASDLRDAQKAITVGSLLKCRELTRRVAYGRSCADIGVIHQLRTHS